MRVVVTLVGPDGAMRRRMVDTAASSDTGPWEELLARALAALPPPTARFREGRSAIFASMTRLSRSPGRTCPGRCTIWSLPCWLSASRHIEPMAAPPASALLVGISSHGERLELCFRKTAVRRGARRVGAVAAIGADLGYL